MKPTLNFRAHLLGLALALGCAAAMPARAEIETFSIDNTHSFANWELRHVVARTSGTFWDIKGKVLLDTGNLAKSSVDATISIYSLNSSHLRRDVHVLADEFLDARNDPEMKFTSTAVHPVTAEKGAMALNRWPTPQQPAGCGPLTPECSPSGPVPARSPAQPRARRHWRMP